MIFGFGFSRAQFYAHFVVLDLVWRACADFQ